MAINVRIVQPLIPSYRVPVFEAIARREDIRLSVWADLAWNTGSLKGTAPIGAFECVHAPLRMVGPFLWQWREREAARSPGADVVLFGWNPRDLLLGHSLRAARRSGKGTIVWGHGFGKALPWLGSFARDRLFSRADACLFYGPIARDRYVSQGADPRRLFVAPNAVDQSRMRVARDAWADADRMRAFRAEHRLGGDPIVVYVSRLEREKRPDLLLEALAIARRTRDDLRAVLIGDGTERAALQAQAAAIGVKDQVTFAGAIYTDEELAPWCCAAACMVHPGAIGLSLFHGFGFGLPVITARGLATHGPEIEALVDGTNGLLYDYPSADALAAAILSMVSDHALHARLSAGALATVDGPKGRDLPAMVEGFMQAIRYANAVRCR